MAEGRGAAISFNIGYLRSLPGILRIAEVVRIYSADFFD